MAAGLRSLVPSFLAAVLFLVAPAVAQPSFLPPTPCGQILTVQAGSLLTFTATAAANTGVPGEIVVLNSGPLPPGATFTPPLPVAASGTNITVSSTFDWTPTGADIGPHSVTLFAGNQLQQLDQCTVLIDVVTSTLPVFIPPTPCNQNLTATVGVPFTYTVSATAPGVAIAILSGALPGTSTHNPPLPLQVAGTPYPVATSVFNWTPTQADTGNHFISYVAFNQFGQSTFCTVQITVSECMLFLGLQAANYNMGGPDRFLLDPLHWFVVTLTDLPTIHLLPNPALQGVHVYAQIGMYNPSVFPWDPLQMSHGLDITLGSGAVPYGNGGSGITMWLTQPPLLGGTLSFGFYIPGI